MWLAIDVLEAQEHLVLTKATIYPNLTKQGRAERDKKLYKAAYPRDIYKGESKTSQFLLQKLGGGRGR